MMENTDRSDMDKIEGTNIAWTYEASRKALRFKGAGALPDFLLPLATSDLNEGIGHDELMRIVPWGDHLDEIELIEGEEITALGPATFAWMNSLRAVLLPKVQIVENGSFYSCKNLERVYMPDVVFIGNGSFERCEKLCGTEEKGNKLVFRQLRHISAYAFHGCKSIASVTVTRKNRVTAEGKVVQGSGSKLEFVGKYAFAECVNLAHFYDGGRESKAFKDETAFYKTLIAEADDDNQG